MVSFTEVKAKKLIIKKKQHERQNSFQETTYQLSNIHFLITLKYQFYPCHIPLVKNGKKCESYINRVV